MDLKDASGELTTDNNIKNGVVHKFRLDRQGRQIGRDEFITPKPEGFFLRRKQSVSPQSSSPIDLFPVAPFIPYGIDGTFLWKQRGCRRG